MTSPAFPSPITANTNRNDAVRLNRECSCDTLDESRLREELADLNDGERIYRMLTDERPYLFAKSPVFVPEGCLRRQAGIIAAIERVVSLPAYRDQVLAYAPRSAHFRPRAAGVFLGYDFHLGEQGSRLIEINTNAGGPLLNALLPRIHHGCCSSAETDGPSLEDRYVDMFREEWRLERGDVPLRFIAIVDDDPPEQFLYPEFLLFQHHFQRQGIAAKILDPSQLVLRDGALCYGQRRVDLVYNRMTDFGLEHEAHRHLREAYLSGAVVLTPHPHAHATYADKRNLAVLTDDKALQELGVDEPTRSLLLDGIAHTEVVRPDWADHYWQERKRYFFKPAAGYGSKAAYRGDKLTRRVFLEILQADYVAQALVVPSERSLTLEGETVSLKLDLRNFVYQAQVQAIACRMYQGQTTNLRTPGGGFAPILVVPNSPV